MTEQSDVVTNLKAQLQDIYERYEVDLGPYAWMSEADRWAELVFCLLNQCTEKGPETTRTAVTVLGDLELLKISKLAALDGATDEGAVVIPYVLKCHGFSEEAAKRGVRLLTQVAKLIQRDYGAKIQRYLRRHGEALRDEMVSALSGECLTKDQLRYATSHWLQNALNLPISLEHWAVLEFCNKNGATLEDLCQAADALDLNLALVDDLLELAMTTARDETLEEGQL